MKDKKRSTPSAKRTEMKASMSKDHYNDFIGKQFIGVSLALALLCWVALTFLLTPFTFTTDPVWMYVWSAFTAFPLVGTFFFAVHMFWLVAVENSRAKKAV